MIYTFTTSKSCCKEKVIFTAIHPSPIIAVTTKTDIFRIWFWQLRILFYLGVAPYKPAYEITQERWVLVKSSTLAQILSVICFWIPFHIFHTTELMHESHSMYTNPKRTPKTYFDLIIASLYCTQNILFCLAIHQRKDQLEQLLNQCSLTAIYAGPELHKGSKFSFRTAGLVFLALIFLTQFGFNSVYFVAVSRSSFYAGLDSPLNLFWNTVMDARRRYFIPKNDSMYTTADYFLGTFELFVRYTHHVSYTIAECLFIGTIPITFWLATKEFQKFVEKHDNINNTFWPRGDKISSKVLSGYYQLKELSDSINDVWAIVLFVWLIGASLRLAFIMDGFLSSGSVFISAGMVITVAFRQVATVLSGDIYRMVDCFKNWIVKRRNWELFSSDKEMKEIRRVLFELEGGPIGIGSSGVYQLSYGFIAQLSVAMITVFLISFDK